MNGRLLPEAHDEYRRALQLVLEKRFDEALEIYARLDYGYRQKAAGDFFGLHYSTLSQIAAQAERI